MMKMVDGAENEGLYGQISSNCPDKNTLNQIFMEQNLTDHRLDLVHRVCNQSISEITLLNQMINEHHILPEKQLEFRSLSQDNFYAHASKTCFSDDNYEISFSLGIPAILLSIAIELDTTTTIAEYQDDNQNSINHWLPHIETIESVSKETIDWVLDACLLLYFHEVCHVLLGHCDYTENNHDETKALELHADLNAGILFSIFLNYLENERNDKLGLRALI